MTDASVDEIATAWLGEMEASVRDVDFARARRIFADDVIGFGSRSAVLDGLNDLERNQWRHVWPVIRDFTFETDRLACGRSGDVVWVACAWTSKGQAADGSSRARRGRMTAVLKQRGERWLAIHTHHSLEP